MPLQVYTEVNMNQNKTFIGFGIQIGLNFYLRNLIKGMHNEGKVVSVIGTTSTVAMISCCTHYLANFLPMSKGKSQSRLRQRY